jgi:hypothetical protein
MGAETTGIPNGGNLPATSIEALPNGNSAIAAGQAHIPGIAPALPFTW